MPPGSLPIQPPTDPPFPQLPARTATPPFLRPLRASVTVSVAIICLTLASSPGGEAPPPPAAATPPPDHPSPAAAPPPHASTLPSLPSLTSLSLPDQFGKVHALEFPRPRPLLLVVGDRRGVSQVDSWIPNLRHHWGHQADIVGVADVHGIPRLFRDRIADAIRKNHPRPVLLDFEGDLVEPLNCTAREANVFVIAPQGAPVARVTGPSNDAKLATLRAALQPWIHP